MNSPPPTAMVPQAYRLNMRIIDHEHGRLFTLLRHLEDPRADTRWVLEQLADYAHKHFLVEEELMEAYEYPAFEAHKAAHDVFRSRVGQMMIDLGETGEVLKTVRVFLGSWLIKHIDKVDRQLVKWIQEHP